MLAPPHPRQKDRLDALYAYEILDTDREKPFDEIVALAAGICETDVALISLVDAERQWFKAETGLGRDETPLEMSICSHVILADEFVEIPDTRLDPRTVDNPVCGGVMDMRFYAGVQLLAENGLPLGTLCVLHGAPKTLTPLQRDALRVLARQVMALLDLRRALRLADVMRQEVDHRVKNSLQAVSALIRLQARQLNSDEAREAMDTVQRRIETVAALHDQLYRTDAGNRIDVARYLENVAEFIRGSAPDTVTVACEAGSFDISSEQAAVLGVIVNEFATNSLKYAFPGGRAGRIELRAALVEDDTVRVDLRDDGQGAMAETPAEGSGLGTKIIEASVEQLGGSYRLIGNGGYAARLEFPRTAQPRLGTTS